MNKTRQKSLPKQCQTEEEEQAKIDFESHRFRYDPYLKLQVYDINYECQKWRNLHRNMVTTLTKASEQHKTKIERANAYCKQPKLTSEPEINKVNEAYLKIVQRSAKNIKSRSAAASAKGSRVTSPTREPVSAISYNPGYSTNAHPSVSHFQTVSSRKNRRHEPVVERAEEGEEHPRHRTRNSHLQVE